MRAVAITITITITITIHVAFMTPTLLRCLAARQLRIAAARAELSASCSGRRLRAAAERVIVERGMPLITKRLLEIYARFGGDVDGFARGGSEAEKAEMPDGAWAQIAVLLQSLGIVERGLAAPSFAADVAASLAELAADPAAREEILRMARRSRRRETPIQFGRVVREGRWLCAGVIAVTVRIRESDTRFGSGDREDPPEIRDDRTQRCYYVDWEGDGTSRSSITGPFDTLVDAEACALKQSSSSGTFAWVL
jgi:hypothetical protein